MISTTRFAIIVNKTEYEANSSVNATTWRMDNICVEQSTTKPTSSPIEEDEFILSSEIKYTELTSLSLNGDNRTFNPGFRNMMKAEIDVVLTNEFLVDLFSQSGQDSDLS